MPEPRENRRSKGRRLLADIADLLRRRARLLDEKSRLEQQLAAIDLQHASKMAEIADVKVELETGRKTRKLPEAPIARPHDDLTRRAARAVEKVLSR